MRKGISELASMALYVGITVSAISAAMTIGMPALENMQEAASIRKAQNFMQTVNSNVQEVVSEGEGSTRTMSVSFDRGQLYFDNETDSLVYELKTDANVISPQTSRRTGNVILSSSANVQVYPAKINSSGEFRVKKKNAECYMMENDVVKACIRKVGSPTDPAQINTSDLLMHYEFDPDGEQKELNANLTVILNGQETTSHGTGYTEMVTTGSFIGTGKVKAVVDSEYGFKYDVLYQLPTGADFLKVDVQNFR